MVTSFSAKPFSFVLALGCSNTYVLICELLPSQFLSANFLKVLLCRRLDEADYDTVFTTLTHLPQDMSEDAVCSHIKDMYLKIPAQE
jgi:hypothetical protein